MGDRIVKEVHKCFKDYTVKELVYSFYQSIPVMKVAVVDKDIR